MLKNPYAMGKVSALLAYAGEFESQ